MIELKRSAGAMHTVIVDLDLEWIGQSYRLQSVVNHLGPAIDTGHYVAVTRHPTSRSEWWLYDDTTVSPASMEEVTSCASLQGWGPMQSYVLFYERA